LNEQWYSNKDLFEMFSQLRKDIETLRREMDRTTTLIRDYNNLRQQVNELMRKVSSIQGATETRKDYTSWIIAGVAMFIAVLSYVGG